MITEKVWISPEGTVITLPCLAGTPQTLDLADYRNAYRLGTVKSLTAERSSTVNSTITLKWDADHIHVEKGFEVERQTEGNTAWEFVKSVSANDPAMSTGITLTGQPTPEGLTYRVRATTNAFAAEEGEAHAYGPAATATVAAIPTAGGGNGGTTPPTPDTPTTTPTPTSEASPTSDGEDDHTVAPVKYYYLTVTQVGSGYVVGAVGISPDRPRG